MKIFTLALAALALLVASDADAARLIVRQRGFGGAAFTSPVGFAGGANVRVRAGLFGRRSVNVNVGAPVVAGGAAFLGPPVYNNAAFRFRRGVNVNVGAFAAPAAFSYGYNQQNFVAPFRYRQAFVAPVVAPQAFSYGYGMQQNLVAPQQAFSYQQALTTGCQQNFVAPQAYSYQQQAVVAPQPCQQQFTYQQADVAPVQTCPQNYTAPVVAPACGSGAAFTASPGYAAMGYGGAALLGGNVYHNHYSLFGGRRSFR
jgi:hypothetical protein